MSILGRVFKTLAATAVGVSLLNPFGAAPVPIININPSSDVPKPFDGFDEGHGDGMVGWTFQLLEPFILTHVGWYDKDADGLSRAFQVGLWEGQGINGNPAPQFSGSQDSSLIGHPDEGLIIPGGTNATLVGVWRVVGLAEPLTLQPGFYQLGGVDTSATADGIKFVTAGPPGYGPLTPPGSPLVIGAFFWPDLPLPPLSTVQTNLHATTNYFLAAGLELGPMLFGTNAPRHQGLV